MKEYKQEIIKFINDNNLNDVFTENNIFYDNYKCNLYAYMRVSTDKQDFGRQILEFYYWAKKKNITICIDNIFCDKYTGKTLKRQEYQKLKEQIKTHDYLVTSNLSRLGRNWDAIKKEWYSLECDNIKRIITDNNNLSVELPNEKKEEQTLNSKMIQDITFSACLYSACIKIKEVSESTKAGLKKAKLKGKKLGKPRGNQSSMLNFIKVLNYMVEHGVGQQKACLMCRYPIDTFKLDIKKCYNKYNTKDYQIILEEIRKENVVLWEHF